MSLTVNDLERTVNSGLATAVKKSEVKLSILFLFFYSIREFSQIMHNVFVYDLLRASATKLANTNRIENPRGFS